MSNTHSELMLEASEAAYAQGTLHIFGNYVVDTSFHQAGGGNGQLSDPATGFRVIAYKKTNADGTTERVLSFTGTEGLYKSITAYKGSAYKGSEPFYTFSSTFPSTSFTQKTHNIHRLLP